MKRWLAFLYWLAMLGLFFAWFLFLRPGFLDGPMSYVVVSGASMEPTLQGGDLAVVRRQGSYQKADIVAFRVGDGIVIHRIVGGSLEEGFIMRGDNSDGMDPWRPTADDIVGCLWFSIPGGGSFLAFLRQPLMLGSLAGGLGMLTVLSGGSGKPPRTSGTSPSRPAGAARGGPPGTRLILGLVLAGALARGLGLLRNRDRGTPG